MSETVARSPLAQDPLGTPLLIATVLHALLILGVSFDITPPTQMKAERMLDITLVQPRQRPKPPDQAEFLAQSSQEGGGQAKPAEAPRDLPSPPTAHPEPKVSPEVLRSASEQPEPAPQQRVVTSKQNEKKAPSRKTETPVKAEKRPDIATLLASTQQEITRLTADLDRRARRTASMSRRKTVSAATQEFKYASYLDAWRKKVETIGNLNYPDEARRQKLFGNLILHVAVRADGSVEQIQVVRSSGEQVLDDAAKRIVRLAAPFAPFPPEIRKEVDVLDITRTWQFLDSNKLFASD